MLHFSGTDCINVVNHAIRTSKTCRMHSTVLFMSIWSSMQEPSSLFCTCSICCKGCIVRACACLCLAEGRYCYNLVQEPFQEIPWSDRGSWRPIMRRGMNTSRELSNWLYVVLALGLQPFFACQKNSNRLSTLVSTRMLMMAAVLIASLIHLTFTSSHITTCYHWNAAATRATSMQMRARENQFLGLWAKAPNNTTELYFVCQASPMAQFKQLRDILARGSLSMARCAHNEPREPLPLKLRITPSGKHGPTLRTPSGFPSFQRVCAQHCHVRMDSSRTHQSRH